MEKRGTGYVIKKAFELQKSIFSRVTVVIFGAMLPMYLSMYFFGGDQKKAGLYLLTMLPCALLLMVVYMGLNWYVSEKYEGRQATFDKVMEIIKTRFVKYINTYFFYMAKVFVGIALLLIPGIYWALKYMPVMFASVIEEREVSPFKLTEAITKGRMGLIYGIFFAVFIPIMFVTIGLLVATGGNSTSPLYILVNMFLSVLLAPFLVSLFVVTYKTLREDASASIDTKAMPAMEEGKGCLLSILAMIGGIAAYATVITGIVVMLMAARGDFKKIAAEAKAKLTPTVTEQVKQGENER